MNSGSRERVLQSVIKYFTSNKLSLVQSNKEGGFVVLSEKLYKEKAANLWKEMSDR